MSELMIGRTGNLSRRDFIRGACIGGAALALPPGGEAMAAGAETGELATLLDISKCIACGACVEACREVNTKYFPEPKKPFPKMFPARVKAEDFSDKREVDDRLTPYNWLYIQTASGEYGGRPFEVHIPRRCLHCQNPPCAKLCPWGAAGREDNGVVRINTDICLGGAKCRQVCPWAIPQRQTGVGLYLKLMPAYGGNGVMYKCDRCFERLGQGKLPACIEACPQSVQSIGPRKEMVAKARELAGAMNGHIYGLKENGGTNTFYVSPVPFDVLNMAIEKGAGKPHLQQVPDMLKAEGVLAYAAFLAPVAGFARGALSLAKRLPDRPYGSPGEQAKDISKEPVQQAFAENQAGDPVHGQIRKGTPEHRSPASTPMRRLYLFLLVALSVTGMAQMPIFKRYYIADIPGLGWLDDFYLVNVLHYVLAAVFLFVICVACVDWLRSWKRDWILNATAYPRIVFIAGLAITGILRIIKNLPSNPVGPFGAMLIDWSHLGFAVLLGVSALAALPGRRSAYARLK